MTAAIKTTYLGPTDTKPSRIRAKTDAMLGITVSWDYALGVNENHAKAALALRDKRAWTHLGRMVGAHFDNASMVWVFESDSCTTDICNARFIK